MASRSLKSVLELALPALSFAVAAAVSACGTQPAATQLSSEPCRKAHVYFDLGNTLVDTRTFDFKKVLWMPGAREYVASLKELGYPMGLLVNVPDTWGATRELKVARTKAFIAELWSDEQPIVWEDFTEGLRVPPSDAQRKPDPFLFVEAVDSAAAAGCPVVFQGEVAGEVAAAELAGMVGWQVHQEGRPFFMPEADVAALTPVTPPIPPIP
jgi:FMN phosphatase YigB (HAD superfamily)